MGVYEMVSSTQSHVNQTFDLRAALKYRQTTIYTHNARESTLAKDRQSTGLICNN